MVQTLCGICRYNKTKQLSEQRILQVIQAFHRIKILKDEAPYEIIDPNDVGAKDEIVSPRADAVLLHSKLGYKFARNDIDVLSAKFKISRYIKEIKNVLQLAGEIASQQLSHNMGKTLFEKIWEKHLVK